MNQFPSEEHIEEQLRISLTNALNQRNKDKNMDQKEKDNLAENYKIFCEYLDKQRLSRMMNGQCCAPPQDNTLDLSKMVEKEIKEKLKYDFNPLKITSDDNSIDLTAIIQQRVDQELEEYKEDVLDFLSEVYGKLDGISRDMISGDDDRKSKAFFNFGSIMHKIYDFLEILEEDKKEKKDDE